MARKPKNDKHKAAVGRKVVAAKEMSEFGLSLNDDLVSIGFAFNHLATSHITYLGINAINRLCKLYAGIDAYIFSRHIIPPCVMPLCPILKIAELYKWDNGPLITTSIRTTIDALYSNVRKIYYYAFDPEFIGQHHVEPKLLQPAFQDERVKVIVRHDSHKELIEREFGIAVCETIVPDCNAEMLAKIALTER